MELTFYLTFVTGLIILFAISFIVGIQIKYLNTSTLKFSADEEMNISQVNFKYENISDRGF